MITSGSLTVLTDGLPTARQGDTHACPVKGHGANPIIKGSTSVFADGLPVARVGDTTACGAVIIKGSQSRFAG